MRRIADIDGLSINALWSIKTFRDEDMHQPFLRYDTFINSVNWKIRNSLQFALQFTITKLLSIIPLSSYH